MRFNWIAITLLALAVTSCRKPSAPATAWAVERRAETNGVHATVRVSAIMLTPGAQLDCELAVQTPAATHLETPQLNFAGTELVDFTALPPSLGNAVNEARQFHWTFQAGPPSVVTNQNVLLKIVSAQTTNSLTIELPAIAIQSAFTPGTFTNALPPLEENHAF